MIRLVSIIIALVLTSAATTYVYHETQQVDINYHQAHRLYDKGRFDPAIGFYKKALTKKPTHTPSLKEIAYSYQWTGRYVDAIDAFKKYLTYKPQDIPVKRSLAETYAWTKDYAKAVALYEEILDVKPDADTMRKLAEVFLWTGEYGKAIDLTRAALKENAKDTKAKLILAEALHYSGKPEEAAVIYRELLADKTVRLGKVEEDNIKKLLGEAYMIKKDYSDSIRQYRDILSRNPRDIRSRIALADILSWEKLYDEAIAEYLEVLKIDPGNIRVKEKLANVYIWKKDYDAAEKLMKEISQDSLGDTGIQTVLGQMLTWQGRYPEAIDCLEAVLAKDKENLVAMEYLADVLSYSKEFNRSIALYRELLKKKDTAAVKKKLADVLSWTRRYYGAIALYDEVLSEKEDPRVRLQKARVLGWAKDYGAALKEYKKIIDYTHDETVRLEMDSKSAYWNNRVNRAIRTYGSLIEKDPENVEAMFDLGQIFAHNEMWERAIGEFKKIINISPDHFRAKEGLEKVELVSERLLWKSGYKFIEADSQSRDMDVRKHTMFNRFNYPLDRNFLITAEHDITARMFSDFSDVLENEITAKFKYTQNPYGWVEGFYTLTAYNKDISPISTFGGKLNIRLFDIGSSTFSYERERLENSSEVIRGGYYGDIYKERIDVDVTARLKAGADCLYETYSDDNSRVEPGFDILYYFSLDPLRLSAKYRYFYKEFDKKVFVYWSPKGFTTNSVEFNWRHYLNKEDIFYGADDLYYEVGYTLSLDSLNTASHKFSGELNWDVNKDLNMNVRGSFSNSSNSVYRDSDLIASLEYFF
ncbi:MAG: tetratricopeptide repeat protein [Candidatus Omnitrophota bacterium]